MITVCTARITYGGAGKLDITRWGADRDPTSAAPLFAPSEALFKLGKSKAIDFDEYARRYRSQLDKTYSDPLFRAVIEMILGGSEQRVVGVCYCVDPARCHRTIWRAFVVEKGAIDGGELPENEQRRVKVVKPSNQGSLF